MELVKNSKRLLQKHQKVVIPAVFKRESGVLLEKSISQIEHFGDDRDFFKRLSTEIFRLKLKTAGFFLAALVSLAGLTGCASTAPRFETAALVDGSPITTDELMYAASIVHRKDDLEKTKRLDFMVYLQKVIDERLIVDEARRMGLEASPSIQKAVQEFILVNAVTLLHKEEVISKISISDDDIINNYRENYLKYGLIELNNQDEAEAALTQLKGGADFEEVFLNYSTPENHKFAAGIVRNRANLKQVFKDALSEVKPGEYTRIFKDNDKFYILKLLSVSPADEVFQKRLRNEIERGIRKQKELGIDHMKELRAKAPVIIDEGLLAEIISSIEKGEKERWTKDQRPLVKVYEAVLTVDEFVAKAYPEKGARAQHMSPPKVTTAVIDYWINVKLVDHEALGRRYELRPELQAKIFNYENQLIMRLFLRSVVAADIDLSEGIIKDFYNSNPTRYMAEARYKVQKLIFETIEEAEAAMNSLKAGTDFGWLSKTRSDPKKDPQPEIWWTSGEVPETLQEVMEAINPGGLSPVFEEKGKFNIILLLEKVKKIPKEFETVREQVKKDYFQVKAEEKLKAYLAKLRKEADIIIYEDVVRKIQEHFSK